MNELLLIPVVVWAIALCIIDCRTRTLPNMLTLGAAALAILLRSYAGTDLLIDGLIGALIGGCFLLFPYLLKGAGAGDLKMCMAVGAILGGRSILYALCITSLAGLVMSVVMILFGHVDRARLRHWAYCAFNVKYDRLAGRASLPKREDERVRMPFGIPIACGLLVLLPW